MRDGKRIVTAQCRVSSPGERRQEESKEVYYQDCRSDVSLHLTEVISSSGQYVRDNS